jgi:hypothetical protein
MRTLSARLSVVALLACAGRAEAQLVPPSNDNCQNAIVIGDGTIQGTSAGATISTNGCGLSGLTPDVWYSYTALRNGLLALDTCGSSFDTTIALYANCQLVMQQITCNDDAPPGSPCGYQSLQSYLTYPVVAGQMLKIRISGSIGQTGPFVLTTKTDTGQPFCLGDAHSATICPCANTVPPSPASGCRNSTGSGARLGATGTPRVSDDSVQLHVQGLPSTTTLLFFQGTGKQTGGFGVYFGDGIRCVAGTTVRLVQKSSFQGASSFPAAGEPRISVKGLIPPGGGTRYYQAWYRNATSFCTSATYNLSNGFEIGWLP